MTSVPPTIAAEMALTRQNIALSVIKQSAEQGQALAKIINDTARSAPVSGALGTNINTSA